MPNEVHNGCPATLIPDTLWRKSSFSGNLGNCVEVAALDNGEVALRNSRFPTGPALVFTPAEWSAFVGGVENGEFPAAPADI
ncbi:DUF397 domain-containing protein [Pseudonocardia nigra]|uniref:DUF397 domain-containing protein n=1 Tax=Pseudonocardia nigra TaxID=1921578 RepID=UPI001C5F2D28|nr:DUF397 domain-containing protein [Pseudonocardia nigra]